jgi:hypothetical protein
LGQLAYDKGIRILAATQAADKAFELDQLNNGILTSVLVADGLYRQQADHHPQDGSIEIQEWLRYGLYGVPALAKKMLPGSEPQYPQLFDFYPMEGMVTFPVRK